ncbi:hypothetical protein AB838_14760 [Rhodobacteraceae bacterium (ex Bugula neritina AB1)]|nr:hypothetical protein AB838_14760 [Rhodobacteraceae bacterium (ex Bugula neritina AB1)]
MTRHRPKIDRIACRRLLRRLVVAKAWRLFASPSDTASVAEGGVATLIDVGPLFWPHRGGHGIFGIMLDDLNHRTAALDSLARAVRGADTNRHDPAGQDSGDVSHSRLVCRAGSRMTINGLRQA